MSGVKFYHQTDPFLREGLAGEWFATGKGPVAVPTGNTAKFLLVNPANSGVLVTIHRYRIHTSTQSEYASVLVNPTTNLPTTQVTSSNRRIGMPSGQAQVFMDQAATAMSGGSTLPYQIPVAASTFTFTEFLIYPAIIVPPGFSIGTNMVNSSASPTNVVSLIDWREMPA